MLSASNLSKLMAVCVTVVMMMALMMKETEALQRAHPERAGSQSRRGPKTTRKPSDTTGTDTEMVLLQLDHSMLLPPTRLMRPLWNHSISPWTFNNTYSEDLFPPMISEARCSLKGCRDAEGGEDRSLESKPILHQMLVLRRVAGSAGRNYHYRLETRLIAVGCTCVRPSVHHQH